MAYHLLLKNNTVSLSQPVKTGKQSQNREDMHDNSFLSFIRWGTEAILEKLWLFNLNGVLTNFLQILHCFFNCLYRFPGIASVRGRVWMRPGNETRQQSVWSAGIRFAHVLSGSDLTSIFKAWNRSFRSCQLVWISPLLSLLSKGEILRLYSIAYVAMETTKKLNFTCQSKSFISIVFTCQVSAC